MIIANAKIPAALTALAVNGDFLSVDILIDGSRIASVEPANGARSGTWDVDGGICLPAFVDMHTHLDKGHIIERAANPDGTFHEALEAARRDRAANWSPEDLRSRMEFALQSAFAHGTSAIRTHIDSTPPQDAISWPVFAEVRDRWADRVTLQAVSLRTIDEVPDDPNGLFDDVARFGGLVGAAIHPGNGSAEAVRALVETAENRGVDLDLHVDETHDPSANMLSVIAEEALRVGFSGTVTCGHCASLMAMEEGAALATLDRVAAAGLAIVSLPLCNAYLLSRQPGRTPRLRPGTLVHEMAERGIPVAIASDNVRDPFHPYGDLDIVEVWREATRMLHLDHPVGAWPRAFSATPAAIMGLADRDLVAPGAPADLVLFTARNWSEFLARPQYDRTVVRSGHIIDARPPEHRTLAPDR